MTRSLWQRNRSLPIISTTILAVGALALSACSSSAPSVASSSAPSVASSSAEAAPSSEAPSEVAPTGGKLAMSLGVQNNPFYQTIQCWATFAAKQRGYEIEFQAPADFDATKNNQIAEALAATKPDGILIDAVFPDEQKTTIESIIAEGVPVFTYMQEIDIPGQSGNIAPNAPELGKLGADEMAKAIGESGKVFIIDFQKGVASTDARYDGFVEQIKNYPNVEVVGFEYTGADTTKAAQVIAAQLQRNPDLKGIFGTNLYGVKGAITALKEAGKLQDIKLIAPDALPEEVDWLKNDEVYALIAQKPGAVAASAVFNFIDVLNGSKEANSTPVLMPDSFITMTKANLTDPSVSPYIYTGADCAGVTEEAVAALDTK